jgi:hypothetical protein
MRQDNLVFVGLRKQKEVLRPMDLPNLAIVEAAQGQAACAFAKEVAG